MALPSQTSRPISRRTHTFRRSRGLRGLFQRRPFQIALLALLVTSVSLWLTLRSGGASDVPADTAAETAGEATAPPEPILAFSAPTPAPNQRSATRESPPSAPPPPESPTIRMGERTQPSSTTSSSLRSPTQPRQEAPKPEPPKSLDPPTAPVDQPPPAPAASRDPAPTAPSHQRALDRMRTGIDLLNTNRPIEARQVLTQAHESGNLSRADAARVRQLLSELNERLVFSPEIVTGDPFTYGYTIRPNDTLSRIASRETLHVDWRLIQRVNRISRPDRIRLGQNLKLIRGPFHAIVYKRDFRMDVYLGEGSDRVFVRSFPVGLGEFDSTPIGDFRVRPNSKLIDPEWVNPRTGERFRSKDPMNPIGSRWIGLEGITEAVRDLHGYGVHGTIEPETIGQQASMGCIRMLADDVELIYEMLVERESIVEIRE